LGKEGKICTLPAPKRTAPDGDNQHETDSRNRETQCGQLRDDKYDCCKDDGEGASVEKGGSRIKCRNLDLT
jgi:hypothetical protein